MRLRKRAITTIRVKAPHALLDKAATCLVDRLPVRLGLEQPPHVIPRVPRRDLSLLQGCADVRDMGGGIYGQGARDAAAAHRPDAHGRGGGVL